MKTGIIQCKSVGKDGVRLDSKFHLSNGLTTVRKIINSRYSIESLNNVTTNIFNGPRFKRIYVNNPLNGIPFMGSSDMLRTHLDSLKLISKKYSKNIDSLKIKENWILVSCSGTIGNTVFTNRDFVDKTASQHIMRIIPDRQKIKEGFLYAYLSSKYGYALLTQGTYGAVIQHIEPAHIENIPVPIFPESKQQEIHNLIIESANLRVEANRLLEEAHNKIVSLLNIDDSERVGNVSIKNILTSHQKRFESQFHKSVGSIYRDKIYESDYILLKDASEKIFRPGIFKRNYVKYGVDFLGGSDITKHIPNSEKKLSKKQTSNFDELTLKEDWILVTCGGTIGTSVLVNSYLADKLASQHILRVIPKDVKSGYLFAFLSSDIGIKVIQSFTYGSVIPQIEPHHLELVPIPLLENEVMDKIHLSVMKYKCNLNEAIVKENQAISLVEKEIESWQQL